MTSLHRNPNTPNHFSTVCPYLLVEDIQNQIAFLQKAFGAIVSNEDSDEQGQIIHAEVSIGEVVIMMGRARPEFPAQPSMNYVFVNDVAATFQSALTAGGQSIMEPGDRDYGMREGGFLDTNGNQWWIAQPLNL